ncbi:hypothetical protein EXM22_03005 [Oceanispirochaeta crateris]|uniref:Uncharacterized protein n=1 Tax=Oceanispirochaeta crateris TaxID=2518645 RepID=A0A5C1QFS1_9SPIO|nr:hypothetical protein [Oceanispirochaeta crateris]QEN07003.1 hypothetical protein EXM22_03005 [Oceanispirochaeta crateris]
MKRKYLAFEILLFVFLFFSCTTPPVELPQNTDPLIVLPREDEFYLLVRPSDHSRLSFEILRDLLPLNESEVYPALERTNETILSGMFHSTLQFSAKMSGDFPAYFVRRSLKKSPFWEKVEDKTYRGPGDILADTLYKDIFLAASEEERLRDLQSLQSSDFSDFQGILNQDDLDWWLSGTPALMLYLPAISAFPLPRGLPSVSEDSSLMFSLIPIPEQPGMYTLNGELRFSEARTAKLWALALRFYLGGRLGLSSRQEEQNALASLSLNTEGSVIHLTDWTMSARGWGDFIASFKEQ